MWGLVGQWGRGNKYSHRLDGMTSREKTIEET
jgi:hypothetical protein